MTIAYDPLTYRTVVARPGEIPYKFWSVNKHVIDAAGAGICTLHSGDDAPGDTTKLWLDLTMPENAVGSVKAYDGASWVALTPALFYSHIAGGAGGFVTDVEMANYIAGLIGGSLQAWSENLDEWSVLDPTAKENTGVAATLDAAHLAAGDPHPQYLTAAEGAAAYQPLDSDLTAIAALTTTAYGRAFLALADAAAGRTALGLGTLATQSGTFSGTSSGTNTGDQTITLTGDVTGSGTSSFAATLATVNANTGSWGLAASVAQFTVNAKGLITAAANVAISIASTAISDATAAGRSMLTAANAAAQTALLSAFAGDAGAGGTKGLVPAPITGDATKFLKGDGTWTAIGGGDALVANPLSQFAATTSAQLAGVMSDETGTGALVFANTPTLVTPVLGAATATSVSVGDDPYAAGWNGSALVPTKNAVYDKIELVLGTTLPAAYQPLDADLTSWAGVTRASGFDTFTATPSSANLLALLTDETGTGSAVFGTAPTIASPVVTGTADVQQAMVWSGDISPSQITSNQNDYAPTGFSTATVLRLNSDASREITGLSGGADGRIILIHNVGSFGIVLKDESLSSAAGNRFALSADVSLTADASTMLQYDATSSRWRAIGGTGSGSGGAGDALTANPLSQFASTTSAQLAGVLSDETGSAGGGLVVFSNSPVLTTPQINDTSADHQYVFAASELAADRTVTLPLLTGNDEFVFKDHAQTLTNKTLTSPVFTAPAIGAAASGSVIACTGAIAQQVRASYTTYTSTSATIPFDDTIPQNTEGTELMTLAITPKSATNRLRIEFSATFRDGGTSGAMAVALFQDSTADALQTRPMIFTATDSSQVMYFEYEMAAGTTSATTFKIRYGVSAGSITIYVNGNRTARQFGATQAAWLTITELTA